MKKLTAIALVCMTGFSLAQTTTVTRTSERWTGFQEDTRISLNGQFYTKAQCEEFFIKRNAAGTFQCRAESTITIKRTDPPAPPPPVVNPPVTSMPPGLNATIPTTGFAAGSGEVRASRTAEVAPRAGDGTGNFRTNCEPTHMAYDDPIVFPGQPGKSHLHTFFGNTGVNAYSTTSTILNTGKSSCRGGILNRSAYWVPTMVDTRTNRAVMPRGSNFYYKTGYNGVRPQDIEPFPEGLRMIAGDPKNAGPGDIYGANAWRYHCFAASNGHGTRIPNCNVGDDMVMEVYFPQCWDGKNLDSPDHKSHMAYANGANPARPGVDAGCTPSHPRALPQITFNIFYPITERNQATYFRLSSDTYTGPAGYSAHGDWWNGWEQDALETWVSTCNNMALDCHSHLLGDGRMIY